MYRHLLIPTDGSELAERAVTHGVSLAKFVGAKITVLIVEERVGTVWWTVAEHRLAEITAKYAEEIKKHATRVLPRYWCRSPLNMPFAKPRRARRSTWPRYGPSLDRREFAAFQSVASSTFCFSSSAFSKAQRRARSFRRRASGPC